MRNFVHLHLHTQYSLLDGGILISKLFDKAKALGFEALAITDHGNMFGAVNFYRKAKEKGIHPIIGCEVYVAPNSRFERISYKGLTDASYHLILLVKDKDGYKNLTKLITAAYFEGFYYKPRIDKEILREHSKGLIALSACLKGEIPVLLLRGDYQGAKNVALEYLSIMGEGNFYLEIQRNQIPDQDKVNEGLISLSKELGIPLVATNDCHYLSPEDAQAHDVLLCIQTGKHVKDKDRMRMSTDQLYLKSAQEMYEIFADEEEAVKLTWEIAEKCCFDFEFGGRHLPSYKVPPGYTLDSYLENLALKGLEERREKGELSPFISFEEYKKRLIEELTIIKEMGFSGYFLIVWDFVKYAKEKGIPVGPGRGSAAGSLVSFCLFITNIDPVRYGLLFERFLNPERVSMPDIDIDFCMERREEVIDYIKDKYGHKNVAKIATFGTLSARAVVRDVGRALEMPYKEVDKIAKLIPNPPGASLSITKAIEEVPQLQQMLKDDRVKELLDISKKLEGLSRHVSTHAAGVVITPKPLLEYLPLYKGTDGEVVTQYPKDDLEALGLLKMDLLGLKTLTVIRMTLELIEKYKGEKIDLDHLPMDDEKTYRLLQDGKTLGVFQLESSGMRELIKRLKPEKFEDLIALVALYRPGPLGSGMVDEFINRKHGVVSEEKIHPKVKEILKETYGVILYQEQVMQLAAQIGGFSMGQADLLRRAMTKKDKNIMITQRNDFIKGALKVGLDKEEASSLFEKMTHFARYGFNKSHSAAYALIAYQTAYLKANYPVEFMAALISSDMGNTEKIYCYIQECKEIGIKVLPPDVNESDVTFSVNGNSIRFGLAAIKNVGETAARAIVEARKDVSFCSIYDFCCRVDTKKVNRKAIESLIKAGAMDSFGKPREILLQVFEKALEMSQKSGHIKAQRFLFDFSDTHVEEGYPEVPPSTTQELLLMEKEAFGFYITGHPLDIYEEKLKKIVAESISQTVEKAEDGSKVVIGGIVSTYKEITTKNDQRMAFVQIEDKEGSVEVVVFPDLFNAKGILLMMDEPIVVTGSVNIDSQTESKKVIAHDIVLLKDAKVPASLDIKLRLYLENIKEEEINLLFNIVKKYSPGDIPLVLEFFSPKKGKAKMQVAEEFYIASKLQFLDELQSLFEENKIEIITK